LKPRITGTSNLLNIETLKPQILETLETTMISVL
jgi:hypothetical protein